MVEHTHPFRNFNDEDDDLNDMFTALIAQEVSPGLDSSRTLGGRSHIGKSNSRTKIGTSILQNNDFIASTESQRRQMCNSSDVQTTI